MSGRVVNIAMLRKKITKIAREFKKNEGKDDMIALTIIEHTGDWTILDTQEWHNQVSLWDIKGCVLYKDNIWSKCGKYPREDYVELNNRGLHIAVVSPPKGKDAPISSLGLSLGIMVTGYVYIFRSYLELDYLYHRIGKDTPPEDDNE